MKLKEVLASLPPEIRQVALERAKAKVKARMAVMRKHAHLFGDVSEPQATDKAGKSEK